MDLKRWMLEHRGEFGQELVVQWGLTLTEALQHAFENGVVHRDLKPGNIIVVENRLECDDDRPLADRFSPRITDFGLAFSMQDPLSGSTASGTIVGTIGYMPPEQVMSGNNRADIRGDIYSLGIILAELALGRPLTKQDNLIGYILNFNRQEETVSLRPIRQLVSLDFYGILKKCVQSNPNRRYQTPGELNADLRRLQLGEPLGLRHSNSRESLQLFVRRNPLLTMAMLMAFIFMATWVVGLSLHQSRLNHANTELNLANRQAQEKNKALAAANAQVKRAERSLKRSNYISNIRLGYSELKDGRLESVHDLVESSKKLAREFEPGRLEFAGRYLDYQSSREYRSYPFKDFDLYLRGVDVKPLKESNQKLLEHNNKYQLLFGSPKFYQNEIINIVDSLKLDRVGLQLRTVWRSEHWYFQNGDTKELLDDQGRYDDISFNAKGDQFYYFTGRDLQNDNAKESVKIVEQAGRTSFYFTGIQYPGLSLDGDMIAGFCQGSPGSGMLKGILYDTRRRQWVETGFQVGAETQMAKISRKPVLSQTGRLVGFLRNAGEPIAIYDHETKTLLEFPWEKQWPNADRIAMGIDETRGLVVASHYDGWMVVWKLDQEKPFARFPKQLKRLSQVGFLPDGRVYITCTYSDRIWIWDPLQQQVDPKVLDHKSEVWSLEFDPSGLFLLSTGDDARVLRWDLQTGRQQVVGTMKSLVTRGRFSADGSHYAACDYSGNVNVWETKGWKLLQSKKVSDQKLRSLAWGPGGDFLICVGMGREIVEYHWHTGQVVAYPTLTDCSDIIYAKTQDEFVVCQQEAHQRILRMKFPGGKIVGSIRSDRMPTRFALDPTGERLAVGFDEGGCGLISIKDGKMERMFGTGTSQDLSEVTDLTFSPDGQNLITAQADGRSRIYETETWEEIGVLQLHQSKLHAITFSPDGKKLVTGDFAGKIKLLELPDR